jgi:membrane protease subunit (stomatin/prohibitin family)
MANKRITELVSANTLTMNDLLVVVNDAQTRKATIQDLIDFLIAQGEFAQLDNGTIPPEQLPALTTTDVAEGTKKYYTAARVLAELLVGLSVQNSAVTSADSILSAIGKLQGQINVREEVAKKGAVNGYAALDGTGKVPAAQLPSGITNVLTGFATGANSTILATDTILAALQKVQGQINAREEVAKKGVANGYAALDGTGKVPAAQLPSGITNVLTGFATGANSTILATDTILTALQKVQGQINAREEVAKKGVANGYASLDGTGKVPVAQLPSGITNVLTGFVTGANSTVLATDTILAAFQKVQGQIAAREEVSKKGAANGYASLDATTRLPKAQLTRGQRALSLDTAGLASTTASETKVYSAQVSASTLAAGDMVNISAWFSSAANTNVKTIKLYIHTADSLGGTLVGTYTVPTGASSFKFERLVSFLTTISAKAGAAPGTSSINGASTVADAAFTVPNISNVCYFVIGATGNSLTCDRVALEALYA